MLAATLLPAFPGIVRGQRGDTFLTGFVFDALTYNNGVLFPEAELAARRFGRGVHGGT